MLCGSCKDSRDGILGFEMCSCPPKKPSQMVFKSSVDDVEYFSFYSKKLLLFLVAFLFAGFVLLGLCLILKEF